MRKRVLLALLAGVLLVLLVAETAQAQVSFSYGRGGGRYPGGYYGRGWGYPYGYGGYPYGYGSSYPYRSGIGIGISIGSGPYYGGYGYGPGYYPRAGYAIEAAPIYRSGGYRASYGPSDNRALVRVSVPTADAKVWFEDTLTEQKGQTRTFLSPALEAGQGYTYVVKATWTEDGREVTREQEVRVRAGEETAVTFGKPPARNAAEIEPRELRDLDRPAPPRPKPEQPKKIVPPPPE